MLGQTLMLYGLVNVMSIVFIVVFTVLPQQVGVCLHLECLIVAETSHFDQVIEKTLIIL